MEQIESMNRDLVALPQCLQSEKLLSFMTSFPTQRFTWLTNEEIASILVNFEKHKDWSTVIRVQRPENGRILLFNRKQVKYKQDMYIWKTNRKGKRLREDRMRLKVEGVPCITAIYVHSDILPTFHRRSYWLNQNPDIVLVHYLNYPYMEDGNHVIRDFSLNRHCQQWQDLAETDVSGQLRPMFANMPWPRQDSSPLIPSAAEVIINHLLNQHFMGRINKSQATDSCRRLLIQPKPTKQEAMASLRCPVSILQPAFTVITQSPHSDHGTSLPVNQSPFAVVTTPVTSPPINQSSSANRILCGESQTLVLDRNQYLVMSPATINLAPHQLTCDVSNVNCDVINQSNCDVTNSAGGDVVNHLNCDVTNGVNCDVTTVNSDAMTASCDVGGECNVDQMIGDTAGTTSVNHRQLSVGCHVKDNFFDDLLPRNLLLPSQPNAGCDVRIADSSDVRSAGSSGRMQSNLGHTPDTSWDSTEMSPEGSENVCPTQKSAGSTGDSVSGEGEQRPDDDFTDNYSTLFDHNLPCDVPEFDASLIDGDALLNQISSMADSSSKDWSLWDANIDQCLKENDPIENCDVISYPSPIYDETSLEVITDYSPDWSYTEGGVKILLIGTWTRPGDYKCVFDDISVESVSLQAGVLRCYCPAHEAGLVDVHVTCNGYAVSRKVKFEYKPVPRQYEQVGTQWLQLKDEEFKFGILDRLKKVESRLNSYDQQQQQQSGSCNLPNMSTFSTAVCGNAGMLGDHVTNHDFESHLICLCCNINRFFAHKPQLSLHFLQDVVTSDAMTADLMTSDGMTLLHYASALGYTRLIHALYVLRLKSRNNSFLHTQCNPKLVDQYDCNALMWACASGSLQCVEILCQWNCADVHSLDVLGRSPAAIAFQLGRREIYDKLESYHETNPRFFNLRDDLLSYDDVTSGSSFCAESLDSGECSMITDTSDSTPNHMFDDVTDYVTPPVATLSLNATYDASLTSQSALFNDEEHRAIAALAKQVLTQRLQPSDDRQPSRCQLNDLHEPPIPVAVDDFPHSLADADMDVDWSDFLRLTSSPPSVHDDDVTSSCLSEHEKRDLFMAAKTLLKSCDDQMPAGGANDAVDLVDAFLVFKHCYHKYKEFVRRKKMNQAAVLIQSKFRSYQEQKRFQRSRHAAILIQSCYRNYKLVGGRKLRYFDSLRNGLSKRHQHQAARKIQRFLRRCRFRIREREMLMQ